MGLSGSEYADPVAFDAAYRSAVTACAVLLMLGGLLSWATIRQTGVARWPGGPGQHRDAGDRTR
ncbi:hypothetical protein [Nocardioides ungokensis]|uniref:hypothetical protein n=1 Tax=Nocardioides ungokensis TaxID=1643322 RepID=UPI001C60DD6C|nr:hypothetical protein [Nocardioides ungokensis]